MPSSISEGDAPYFEQPIRWRLDSVNGNQLERRWEGRADQLLDDFEALATGAQQAEYSATGARGEVVTRYGNVPGDGSVEVPTVAFTMRTEEISQSIFNHPKFSDLGPTAVKIVRDGAADFKGYQVTADLLDAYYSEGAGDPFRYALAIEAFNLLIHGDDNYLVTQSYTLSMTRTSSFGFPLSLIFADDGKLFSSSGLSAYTATTLPFQVPQLNTLSSAEALQLVFAWRKRGTDVQSLPNGNVQVTEQWQSARWSLLLYYISSWG